MDSTDQYRFEEPENNDIDYNNQNLASVYLDKESKGEGITMLRLKNETDCEP